MSWPPPRIQRSDGLNPQLRHYARLVAQALRHVLTGRDRPLIIAAADPLASMFRQANTYPHLAPGEIKGNSERMAPHELAAAARKVLDDLYAAQVAEMKALYVKREAEGRATADVAADLDMKPGAVRVAKSRVLLRLRHELGDLPG